MFSQKNFLSSSQTGFASENVAPMDSQEKIDQCLCKRPKARILCTKCGFTVNGCRVYHSCPSHPKIIYSMDLSECPKCRAKWPELQEMPDA